MMSLFCLIVNDFSAVGCRLYLWPHGMISKLERNNFTVFETLKSREPQTLSIKGQIVHILSFEG